MAGPTGTRPTGAKVGKRQTALAALLIALLGGGAFYGASQIDRGTEESNAGDGLASTGGDDGEVPAEGEPVALASADTDADPDTDTAPGDGASVADADADGVETDLADEGGVEDTDPNQDEVAQDDEPDTAPGADGPTFDVVRIDGSGSALIAGTATPLADVAVMLDGQEISFDKADSSGQFVSLFNLQPSDVPRVISLTMTADDGTVTQSGATVIVQPNTVLPPRPAPVPEPSVGPTPEIVAETPSLPAPDSKPPILDVDTAMLAPVPEAGTRPPVDGGAAPSPDALAAPAAPEPGSNAGDLNVVPGASSPVKAGDVPRLDGGALDEAPPVDTALAPAPTVPEGSFITPEAAPSVDESGAGVTVADGAPDAPDTAPGLAPVTGATPDTNLTAEVAPPAAPDQSGEDTALALSTKEADADPDTGGETAALDTDPGESAQPDPPAISDTPPEVVALAPGLAQPATPETGAPTPPAEGTPIPEAAPVPEAPTVLLADESGIRVLQDGGPPDAQTVIIDTISYDLAGEVFLGGRGAPGGYVRVYLDNTPIKTTEIGVDGQWRTPLPNVDSGIYTLRVDEVDDAGTVTSRVETPFQREEPDLLARLVQSQQDGAGAPEESDVEAETTLDVASAETGETVTPEAGDAPPPLLSGEGRPELLVVQPGNTLWGIASKQYGEGFMYVRVFEANKERIRDPHWIYPGQVFAIPRDQ